MTEKALLSIVLPAFNEEGNILPLTAELAAALPALAPWAVECIFVDEAPNLGRAHIEDAQKVLLHRVPTVLS